MSQQFCLKWNNHTTNMLQVFENLLTTEALVDVTLACDGLSLKAHKMVLSACSPFFQSLFLENPCKHPIVIMKDMRYCDLKAIIDFMYRGEVNVSHDQLSALLKTAETLKVKGLAEVTGENRQASGIVQHEIIQQNASTPTPVPPSAQRTDTPPLQGKRKRGRPRKRSLSDSNRSDDEGVPPKIKETNSDIEELSGDASMEATSDNRSSGGPISCNSQSQVPIHSSNNVNTFSKSHLSTSQDPQGEEPASGDENEFEVEPSKLLEQTLTTENVPSNSHNSTGPITLPSVSGLEISRRSMSSTDSGSQALVPVSIPSDSLGSNVQGPDSPQDVKPQILSFDDPPISPVAGTSHGSDRSLMMYMDQSGVASIPGPSNFQDNSALVPHDSQPQVNRKTNLVVQKKRNINPFRNPEPNPSLEPIADLQPEIIEDNLNEAAMTETGEIEARISKNKVSRKTNLVVDKKINSFRNQETNPSLEPITDLVPEIKEEDDSNEAAMAKTGEAEAQSSKNNVNRKTNLAVDKATYINPFRNQETNPNLEPITDLIPEIKEEDDSNEAAMAETRETETQSSKNNVNRKTNLVVDNEINSSRNQEPNQSLEPIANVSPEIKEEDNSNEVFMAITGEIESQNSKNNVNRKTNRVVDKETDINSYRNQETNPSLEPITDLVSEIKDDDSNEAAMAETRETEAQSSKNNGKRMTHFEGKRKNLDSTISIEPRPKLGLSQSQVVATSLNQEIQKESDSNEANIPITEIVQNEGYRKKDEAKCDNGGQTGKNKSPNCKDTVISKTNIARKKRINLDPIVSLECIPIKITTSILEQTTDLEHSINEKSDSNKAVSMDKTAKSEARNIKNDCRSRKGGAQTGKKKRQNSKDEVKRTSYVRRSKRTKLDPIVSLESIPSLEQTTSQTIINEESYLNKGKAVDQTENNKARNIKKKSNSLKGGVQARKKRDQDSEVEAKRKLYLIKTKEAELNPMRSLRSNSSFKQTTSLEPTVKEENESEEAIAMDQTEKCESGEPTGMEENQNRVEVNMKTYLGRKKKTNLNPIVSLQPIINLSSTKPNINLEPSTSHESSINLIPSESIRPSTSSDPTSEEQNCNEDTSMNETVENEAQDSNSEDDFDSDFYLHYKHYMAVQKSLHQFKCEKCDYASVSKSGLNSHMFTHTEHCPFTCAYCEYRGKRHSYLRKHVLHKHYKMCTMHMLRVPDEDYYET